LFQKQAKDPKSWEEGSGGYGYNSAYIGGSSANALQPRSAISISNPGKTVMFATTAFAKKDGLQEYPYTEPYEWVNAKGETLGRLQPSTHFRASGRALIAWCDGHVSREKPNKATGPNYYGGNNETRRIGWFGPEDNNGFWNPQR
jgi:prepilin-type processing-associated H-X9-DG protein